MTVYKRKGFDFCTSPGCMSQTYGGHIDGWFYCPEHEPEGDPDRDLNPPPPYVPIDGEEFPSEETVQDCLAALGRSQRCDARPD